MIKLERGAMHYQKVAEELNRKVSILQNENTLLKSEVDRLSIELQYSIRNAKQLQTELISKDKEIKEKEDVIQSINSDIERFGSEVDLLINYFEAMKEREDKETNIDTLTLLNSKNFGESRDLMFGINIDDEFIKNSPIDTIKYYICSLDSFGRANFVLEHIDLKDRFELILVIKAFSAYIQKMSQDDGNYLKGILEIVPADIFKKPYIEYWGEDPERVIEYFSMFKKKYSLVGELHFEIMDDIKG